MFVSTEKEQISLPLENGGELFKSTSPAGSYPDSLNGFPAGTELCDPVPVPALYTDVTVVPEQEKQELEQTISTLEGEIAGLRLQHRSLDRTRREALNKILDIKGSIRVFCRVRPILLTDRRRIHQPISTELEKIVVRSGGSRKEFSFDKVFPQEASQEDVFVEVEPILRSALDGHNVCILAYGQTGTGKTFTMDGTNDQLGIAPRALSDQDFVLLISFETALFLMDKCCDAIIIQDGTNDQLGIAPRALVQLFHNASLDKSSSYTFSMSMLEVYMGSLRDLLAPKSFSRAYETISRCNLNIQTDPKGLVEIEGLSEVPISDFTKASWWYTKGRRVRSTSWTNVNEASSRSHCLTRITIFRRGVASEAKAEVSKLWMVDLGGSERLLKTGATGQTLDEGRAINLSLSALGDVIAALRRKRGHVPYRNSKLTQILKDSLGDGSKILMLVHVSPFEEDVGETTYSLSFAKRARAVESTKELPEDLKKQKEKRIAKLEEEMREAEEECQKVRNQIQKAEFLLNENKRLFSSTYQPPEDEGKAPASPKGDLVQVSRASLTFEKTTRRKFSNSMPRFMNSTVASRQRLGAAEKEIDSRANSSRTGTRSSIQFSGSQSLSYSDLRFKSILRSNKKSRYGETNTPAMESPKCSDLDSKTTSMPRSKIVTSSNPNLRVTLSRHRRRMSDFI